MRSSQLTFEEQEHIMRVIRQAELLEHTEMERIGYVRNTFTFVLFTYYFSWLLSPRLPEGTLSSSEFLPGGGEVGQGHGRAAPTHLSFLWRRPWLSFCWK